MDNGAGSIPAKVLKRKMLTVAETKNATIVAGVTAFFLWPIPATVEMLTGENFIWPVAALISAKLIGQTWPWEATFPEFFKGYIAGGTVYATSLYMRQKDIEKAIDAEVNSLEGRVTTLAEKTALSKVTDLCAGDFGKGFVGGMICPQLKSIKF